MMAALNVVCCCLLPLVSTNDITQEHRLVMPRVPKSCHTCAGVVQRLAIIHIVHASHYSSTDTWEL